MEQTRGALLMDQVAPNVLYI